MKKLFTLTSKQHGQGSVKFAWHPQGAFLATCGQNRIVNIVNRQGDDHAQLPLEGTGACLELKWDRHGETLAVMQQGSPIIKLWDANQNSETSLDTGMKDLSMLAWAVSGPQLAIATAKGNVLIYNKKTLKKQSVVGKHAKRITSGAWNTESKLVLTSEDKQVTISTVEGDLLNTASLKGEGSQLQISSRYGGSMEKDAKDKDTIVSVLVGGQSLLVFEMDEPTGGAEHRFAPQYGSIVAYEWFGDGCVAVIFESGYFVVMSTHAKEVNEELFSARLHTGALTSLAISPMLKRAATCAANVVKVVDLSDEFTELVGEGVTLDEESGEVQQIGWTNDGQVLSVSSSSGMVYNFLACLPVLADAHATEYMYLTSLKELSVRSALPEQAEAPPRTLQISVEPTFVALGPNHAALGMNNHVSYHAINQPGCPLIGEREYMGTVDQVKLNQEFVAVHFMGRAILHPLGGREEGSTPTFPQHSEPNDLSCMALSKDFFVYGTRRGTINYVYLPDMTQINEFRHETGIVNIFANELATRLVFIDDTGAGFLYNPVSDQTLPIPRFSATTLKVLWDSADLGVFIAYDRKAIQVYVYAPHSVNGATVMLVSASKLSSGLNPILVYNGALVCQGDNGAIATPVLPSHSAIQQVQQRGGASADKLRACFAQNLDLLRLTRAWEVSKLLNDKELLVKLGQAAMQHLDVPLALRVFRQLGDAGMAMALQKLEGIEDAHLLAGHVALMFDQHARAQELFLASMRPMAALEMRRDLLHWEHALKLAKTLAADQVASISREFAQQLEFRGDFEQALAMFQQGLSGGPQAGSAEHERSCKVGIARMTMRLGDVTRGLQLALETRDPQCCRDCAIILEGLKQWQDAARLYEEGELPDKAAAIYIKTKHWAAAAPLMARISTPKLHSEFAKAKESEGRYEDAVVAYERANDSDSVVRLLLSHANKPQRAFAIVRENKSSQGGLLVAKYCQQQGDTRSAIEFLLLAKKSEDAFELATANDQMDAYTSALGKEGTVEEYKKVASHFEQRGNHQKAGEFWFLCKEYSRALRLFLYCGERAVNQAIEVVGRARSDMLTHTLIDFLMGETDGVPKDPNYIFRLYMALGNYPQAAKTAIIIARQEQELGNYRVAHQLLFDTHRELTSQRIHVPQELAQALMLLHSYIVVKPLSKMEDHMAAARMLIRVARSISRFPMHAVPILTSTVVECHRAGLRGAAFEYATTLMRPEYRPQLQEPYKRKIEAIVRKPGDKTDVPEVETASPFDPSVRLPESGLECPSTKNTIPYCIATGRHIVLSDMCLCPSCAFPASFSAFTKLMESAGKCPMCMQDVPLNSIVRMEETDAKTWLTKQTSKPPSKK